MIKLFVTGGTFDKEYDELTGNLFFRDTKVGEMLGRGRCKVPVTVRTLMMIDSLEMTTADRELILAQVRSCSEKRIIITHGTDSLEVTAKFLGKAVKDKTVIVTGAMVPYKFGSSDGIFNLGSAVAFAQTLGPGVYVVMNGKFFPYDNVRKNKALGIFEEITVNPAHLE